GLRRPPQRARKRRRLIFQHRLEPAMSFNPRASLLALSLLATLALASGAALAQSKPSIAAAPRSAPPPAAAQAQPVNALETIGPGDMVKVNVFRNPELATDARVTDNGTILFPLIGEVEIG